MPAPTFPNNAHRYDPYRTFKFQVLIGKTVVAGLSKMGAIKRTTEAVKWRSAGDPSFQRVIPGGSSFEAVTLEQGLSHDPVFEEWASAVNNVAEGDGGVKPEELSPRGNHQCSEPPGHPGNHLQAETRLGQRVPGIAGV